MSQTLTRKELEAWEDYAIGKPCAKHPGSEVKKGRYGNWCGNKTPIGGWCDGGWPSDEWLINFRKEQV